MLNRIKIFIKRGLLWGLQRRTRRAGVLDSPSAPLIIAPHPDDEVFGCGGFIAHSIAGGVLPHVVLLTGGGGSHRGCCGMDEEIVVSERRKLTRQALASLGIPSSHIHFLDFQDGHISDRPQPEMEKLKQLALSLKPSAIFVPHHGEGWPDHLAAREIGLELALLTGATAIEYCVWFWFYKQRRVDWSRARQLPLSEAEHRAKLEAIRIYSSTSASCGNPYIGQLPSLFLRAHRTPRELYFPAD